MEMSSLEQYIKDFERSLIRRALSPKTGQSYHWAFKFLLKVLKDRELSRESIEEWQDAMIESGLSAKSRSLAITAVRQLIRWGVDRELLDHRLERALVKVKVPDGKPHPIKRDDLNKIKIYFASNNSMTLEHLRDRALFFYLLTTGARVSEVLQVKRNNWEKPVVIQKGGGEKALYTTDSVKGFIETYLKARTDTSSWLWVTHQTHVPAHQFTPNGARRIWHKISKRLGIPYWTTHAIRHTCATELLEAGIPELVIAGHLGHHGLKNLHIYGQVREKQKQEVIAVMNNLVMA